MSGHIINMKLDSHPVIGSLKLDPDRRLLRAILEIPEHGALRQVFQVHIRKNDPTPSIELEWSEDDAGIVMAHKAQGKILNTLFPQARRAVFEGINWT